MIYTSLVATHRDHQRSVLLSLATLGHAFLSACRSPQLGKRILAHGKYHGPDLFRKSAPERKLSGFTNRLESKADGTFLAAREWGNF